MNRFPDNIAGDLVKIGSAFVRIRIRRGPADVEGVTVETHIGRNRIDPCGLCLDLGYGLALVGRCRGLI